MVNSLTQAIQFGLRDKQVNGKDFQIIVPLYSELMAKGAGKNIEGVFGSMNWNWQLPDAGTKAFVQSFGTKYGFPPSNSAQTCYAQTLLYADAVARAGSFDPCAVVEALEGFSNPANVYEALEIVEITPRAQVEYAPDHPMFAGGALGTCNAG